MDDDNFISFYDFHNKMVLMFLSLVDSLVNLIIYAKIFHIYVFFYLIIICKFLKNNIVTWEVSPKFIEFFDEIGFYGVTILVSLII